MDESITEKKTSVKIIERQVSQKELLVEQLKKTPVVHVACDKIGLGRATYYRWRNEDEKFKEDSDVALLEGSQLINDLAESQLISAIKDKNMTAIIFWLKNHHTNYKTKVELSGTINTKNEPLTPEEENLVRNALKLASLDLKENLDVTD